MAGSANSLTKSCPAPTPATIDGLTRLNGGASARARRSCVRGEAHSSMRNGIRCVGAMALRVSPS
jgi:hypothetical protein